jgi:thiosulfate/3-mercaptopyruvate sulfurtransferase
MDNTQLVVSPTWLFEHLHDPHIVIVDCRFSLADPQLGKQQYQASHIENSYYLDLNQDLSSPVGQHAVDILYLMSMISLTNYQQLE